MALTSTLQLWLTGVKVEKCVEQAKEEFALEGVCGKAVGTSGP